MPLNFKILYWLYSHCNKADFEKINKEINCQKIRNKMFRKKSSNGKFNIAWNRYFCKDSNFKYFFLSYLKQKEFFEIQTSKITVSVKRSIYYTSTYLWREISLPFCSANLSQDLHFFWQKIQFLLQISLKLKTI